MSASPPPVRRVVLAYSGGLDTSIIVPWLREQYGAEVVCFCADLGQGEELSGLRQRALASGASDCVIEDLREAFARDFLFPMLQAGAVYEHDYLLGTAIARPLIAARQVALAQAVGADALAHGCTGKGNDQVRFELTFQALAPRLKVIAPWREWDIRSRDDALAYAERAGLEIIWKRTSLYSRDRNLWHLSHEGGPLENPDTEPEPDMFQWTVDPRQAPDEAEELSLDFAGGRPVALDGEALSPAALIAALNERAARHGVGRVDLVENRLVGIKSRGVYETPGGTVLVAAHRALESLCLDRDTAHYKAQVGLRLAELIYYGQWFHPLREALQAFVSATQVRVTGRVRLRLHKGAVTVIGRSSTESLYREDLATFGADDVYDQRDAGGFIRLFGLPMKVQAMLRGASEEAQALAAPDQGWFKRD
jgi:argininosuccinate synthase